MYRSIDLNEVVVTIVGLGVRVGERFPKSNFFKICLELRKIALDCDSQVTWISRPNMKIRTGVAGVTIGTLLLSLYCLSHIDLKYQKLSTVEVIQLSETLVNGIILLSASIYFLFSVETRIKRSRALKALHELRSMAHIIDMLQLTKDPGMLDDNAIRTSHSPPREFTLFELNRYLDYCSEMFSLIGKLAAIYSERLPDPEIVSAASEIESLCSSLSRKVWQKMSSAAQLQLPDPPTDT